MSAAAVEIVVAEPLDHGMRQQDAGLGLAVRGMLHRKIGGGIDQHLAGELWAVAVARGKRHDGGEIAAGAVAADQQLRGVDAELFRVGGNPFRRRDGVVDGGGEFVLGREAVIDRDDDQLAFMRRACGRPRHGNRDRRSPSRRHGRIPGTARGRWSCAASSACRCAPESRRAARGSKAACPIPVRAARDWLTKRAFR